MDSARSNLDFVTPCYHRRLPLEGGRGEGSKYSRRDQAAAACVGLKKPILGDATVVEGAVGLGKRGLRTAMFVSGQLELANLVV